MNTANCTVCGREFGIKPSAVAKSVWGGGRRIPTHNYDHDMVLLKEAAMEAARLAAIAKATGEKA